MSPRGPTHHPAAGETIQEHELEQQRDHLAEDQVQQTAPKKETWQGWQSDASPSMPRDQLLANLRDVYGIDIDTDRIERWEADGFLPPARGGYPPSRAFLIRVLLKAEHAGLDPDTIRTLARITADTLDEDDKLDTRERLAELTDAAKRNQQTWLDWMPEGAPMPAVFNRADLLDRLRDEGIEVTPSTLEYYRYTGVLPRPIRRHYGGVTQAVYPEWFIGAIKYLREMQEHGRSLEDIKPWMRAYALNTVQWLDPLAEPTEVLDMSLRNFASEVAERLTGFERTNSIAVVITDDDGNEIYRHETPARRG